ncbi:YTH domain-containing protein ECT1-like [Andrographis paniculata]|uniref:YTH domain-containing protein ECT1-like n=1 Tax=Andrographis paniculata TaxID=175694 RepID=UPI0021E7C1D8|nr:YTH domain-containing protein ECT1-like [Andrographis paniculata]
MDDEDHLGLVASAGDRGVELHNVTEQPISPKDEKVMSAIPSSEVAISGTSRNIKEQPVRSEASGALSTTHPLNSYTPPEPSYFYIGGSGNWDEHSPYASSNNLHVMPQGMYNDNSSLFYPPGYGFDSQMAYGQFSPFGGPLSPVTFDGQLFSPHQMPVSPPYYPPISPGPQHVTSAHAPSQHDLLPTGSSSQDNLIDNAFFGPGSGYFLPVGSFGGDLSGSGSLGLYKFPGELGSSDSLQSHSNSLSSSKFMSQISSRNAYQQPIGTLGSYEQNVAQGFGLMSNSPGQYSHSGSNQGPIGSNRIQFAPDKGGRRERVRDNVNIPSDAFDASNDRNRGPRASKHKGNGLSPRGGATSGIKDVESASGLKATHFNTKDLVTDYEHARFFVIKSFSEDNIHKSIKYNIWASTPLGNRKLDAAYKEAKGKESYCPVFLFFSVNASGQFCGVAEMVGQVDFEHDAEYWHQDRWSGQFPIKWHIIKDVPNSRFRHILLENNDNKPVTHSRDSQEVKLQQGVEMLKIFKSYESETSLLDDFNYYDEREKALMEKKAKQRANTTALPTESINQLSENLADTLRMDNGKKHLQT